MDRISVLDHGYVELIETWGSDERIVEAARMSTGKGFLGWGPKEVACPRCGRTGTSKRDEAVRQGRARPLPCDGIGAEPGQGCDLRQEPGDEKLLRFLWENKHATPFEMAGATFVIQAPIFVFREWHRHRTQSYNEMSARYTPLPDVNYIPSTERLMARATSNKQAKAADGAEELTLESALNFQSSLKDSYRESERLYQWALRAGVPKELARVHLPVGRYSRMMASTDLRNWLGFLSLRMAPNAQWEIRQFANAVHEVLSLKFSRTLALFDAGRT